MSRQIGRWSKVRPSDYIGNTAASVPDKDTFSSELREVIKGNYHEASYQELGRDIKYYWEADWYMFCLDNSTPEWHDNHNLKMLCNKSTMIYWETSVQTENFGCYARVVAASIYKCWFHFHQSEPNTHFGKYFAHPFQITQEGPQGISETLKAHAYLCDDIESQVALKKGITGKTHPIGPNQWPNYHLLPLSRAIIMLLNKDSVSPPTRNEKQRLLLDEQAERWSVVLVLTGDKRGLSETVSFDAIKAEALLLSRNDVDCIDSANIIRVSLKTAVHFITRLQHREERALPTSSQGRSSSTPDAIDDDGFVVVERPAKSKWCWSAIQNTKDLKRDGVLSAFKDADEYADAVFYNSSKSEWKMYAIKSANYSIDHPQEDDRFPDYIQHPWSPSMI